MGSDSGRWVVISYNAGDWHKLGNCIFNLPYSFWSIIYRQHFYLITTFVINVLWFSEADRKDDEIGVDWFKEAEEAEEEEEEEDEDERIPQVGLNLFD